MPSQLYYNENKMTKHMKSSFDLSRFLKEIILSAHNNQIKLATSFVI